MNKFWTITGVLLASLLAAGFAMLTPDGRDSRFDEKANLALRRTVHHLLVEAGDATTQIPPVQQMKPNAFSIRIGHAFNYDRLPALLQQSLQMHGITKAYDVAVLDCVKNELQLGYNVQDLLQGQPVPCGGRVRNQGCYVLQVSFESAPKGADQRLVWWLAAGAFALVVSAYAVRKQTDRRPLAEKSDLPEPAEVTDQLIVGTSRFNVVTQTLVSGNEAFNLTHREAKLLRFFVDHSNQVLEREAILNAVWQDEGITVGRSVDVFVSRLRKMLQHDPAVQIKAVHGVGYRFEVTA